MGVGDGLIGQAGNASQAGGQFNAAKPVHKAFGLIKIAVDLKTEHTATSKKLFLGDNVIGMGCQAWIIDGFDFGMGFQKLSDAQGDLILLLDAQLQRL